MKIKETIERELERVRKDAYDEISIKEEMGIL